MKPNLVPNLAELGVEFQTTWAAHIAAVEAEEADPTLPGAGGASDQAADRIFALSKQIADLPAVGAADLRVKALALSYWQEGSSLEMDRLEIKERLSRQIAAGLLAAKQDSVVNDTTVITSLVPFNPTIDLATISEREVFDLYQILSSASDLISATLHGRSGSMTSYLDDWQALLFAACSDMADVVHAMTPADDNERSMRNFFLAAMRLRVAEGPVDICGPGAPDSWGGSAE